MSSDNSAKASSDSMTSENHEALIKSARMHAALLTGGDAPFAVKAAGYTICSLAAALERMEKGMAYQEEKAKGLVEAVEKLQTQIKTLEMHQWRLLVRNQTLETASDNWDEATSFSIDCQPVFDALAHYRQGQEKE